MTDLQEYKLNGERNKTDRYEKMLLVRSMELTEMTTAQKAVLYSKLEAKDNEFLSGVHITYNGMTVTGWKKWGAQYYIGSLPYSHVTDGRQYIMLYSGGAVFYYRNAENSLFLTDDLDVDEDSSSLENINFVTKLDFLIKDTDGNITSMPSKVEKTTDAEGVECYRVTADVYKDSVLWRCSWDAYTDAIYKAEIMSWKTHSKEEVKNVTSVGGSTGDVPLKTINGNEITGEGNIEVEGMKTYVLTNMTQDEKVELFNALMADKTLIYRINLYYNSNEKVIYSDFATTAIYLGGFDFHATTSKIYTNKYIFTCFWYNGGKSLGRYDVDYRALAAPSYITVKDDGNITDKLYFKGSYFPEAPVFFQNSNKTSYALTNTWQKENNEVTFKCSLMVNGELYDGKWLWKYGDYAFTTVSWKKHTGDVNTVNGESGDVTLKTINGEALTGNGDITVKTDGDIVTIRYGQDPRNVDAYKVLDGYTAINDAVSVNLQYGQWVYAVTNVCHHSTTSTVTFDAFFPSNLRNRELSYSSFTLSEDGNCTMDFNKSCHVPTLMGEDTADIRLKYINGQSLIGDGDIIISGGGGGSELTLKTLNGQSLIGEGNVEIQAGEVFSVNGQKGDVTIDLPTVPKKVSAFTNDANYMSSSDASKIVILTESEYEALETKDEKTIYFTTEDK